MSVSTAAMGLSELASFLVANGTYATYADAVAALNIVVVDGVGATGTAIAVSGGPAQMVVGAVGDTALDVAAQATLQATGTNVTTAGIGLLQGETIGAAGLLGVDVGIVGAAAAPLLGVALGANLYRSNPELWTKISQKLLPFCYPGTTLIPTWAEIAQTAWRTSVAKKVIDALKELFTEEGIGKEGLKFPEYRDSGETVISGAGVASVVAEVISCFSYTGDGTFEVSQSGTPGGGVGICVNAFYGSSESLGSTVTVYGVPEGLGRLGDNNRYISSATVHFYPTGSGSTRVQHCDVTYNPNSSGTIPFGIFEGIKVHPVGGAELIDISGIGAVPVDNPYPEGTSQWQGTTPIEIPESKPAIIGTDPGTGNPVTQPMVPISIPQEVPQTDPDPEIKPADWPPNLPPPVKVPSPDPEVQPDPTITDDPESQVEPYIQPLPIPWVTTTPETEEETQTDPTLDPTRPRPPVQTITDPPVELGPDPVGISPWPAMPDTPSPFPLDGSAGLITVYNPTAQELYAFESWLWVTLSQASVQTVWNNPFDGVIGLFELYCTPTINGRKTIRSAFLDSGIAADTVSRYTEIDCGTLGIPEYYGNYLDYSPYTKAHIYLPFIGIQELNVDDIVGHAVNVTYRIDEYNGSCIAMITVAKVTEVNGEEVEYSNTMYQFSGNCAVELPISGGNQSSILAGMMTANAYQQAAQISANAQMIGGIASIIGGVASLALGGVGGIGGIGSGIAQMGQSAATAAYGQASALSNMLSGKATVQKSGSFGSSHGALGIKVPFITITRPKQIQVANYNELYGYPAHKMVTVGSCTGFLRCREVHVVSATASDAEKAVIESMLKTGVFVTP